MVAAVVAFSLALAGVIASVSKWEKKIFLGGEIEIHTTQYAK